MAEQFSTTKCTLRKKKEVPTFVQKSLFDHGNTSVSSVNSGRLSLLSNVRLQETISSSSRLSSFSQKKDKTNALENYHLEYNIYLLRKVQNRVLDKNKQEKEENLKKCLVSLKLELQELLDKYVNLSKEIGYFKKFIEILTETNQKIEDGKKLLKILKENDFEGILKSLSSSLDHTTNQLQLVDIDKSIIDEAFDKNIWGFGSEIDECLKKIDSSISNKKEGVAKIAGELVEIKELLSESAILREKFDSVIEKMSDEILENNHKVFTDIIKKAFSQREELKQDFISLGLNCNLGFLEDGVNTWEFSPELSQTENSAFVAPNSSSTPQH